MERSETLGELGKALSAAQGELGVAVKGSFNPYYKSNYADLGEVWRVARPVLAKHGLSVLQFLVDAGPERTGLRTILLHSSGEWVSEVVSSRLGAGKDGKIKDDAQGVGSATTYLRRYGLSACLGIVSDDDDDGNAARREEPEGPPPVWFEELLSAVEIAPGKTELDQLRAEARKRLGEMTDTMKLSMQTAVNDRVAALGRE